MLRDHTSALSVRDMNARSENSQRHSQASSGGNKRTKKQEAKRKKREEMSSFTLDGETENASDLSHHPALNTSLQESLTSVSPYTQVVGKRIIGSGSFGKLEGWIWAVLGRTSKFTEQVCSNFSASLTPNGPF